jgi:hypothetical protein
LCAKASLPSGRYGSVEKRFTILGKKIRDRGKKIRIILNVASDLNIVASKEKLFPFPKG